MINVKLKCSVQSGENVLQDIWFFLAFAMTVLLHSWVVFLTEHQVHEAKYYTNGMAGISDSNNVF